jgi:RNA polymerase sigma factor (sigma-70 family)
MFQNGILSNMSSRSQEDFIMIIQENQSIINSICHAYFRDADDFKDARQDVILQLWRSFPTFRGESKVSSWVYRVALNTILSKRKKDRDSDKNEPLTDAHLDHYEDFSGDDLQGFAELINHLEDAEKAIVLLLMEGYGNKEIAVILDYTPTNVSTRLTRIRQKLRKQYGHEIK